jgi:hypothetical protein
MNRRPEHSSFIHVREIANAASFLNLAPFPSSLCFAKKRNPIKPYGISSSLRSHSSPQWTLYQTSVTQFRPPNNLKPNPLLDMIPKSLPFPKYPLLPPPIFSPQYLNTWLNSIHARNIS